MRFLPYEKAKKYVHKVNLKNQKEWQDFSKSDKKPAFIPAAPQKVYKGKGWTNLGDWLGTGVFAPKDREYWPYEKANEFAQSSGIKSAKQWFLASKGDELPATLPANPAQIYKQKGWISWGDFLGTGRIADQQKKYWEYKKARDFVHALKFRGEDGIPIVDQEKNPAVRFAYKG